jgi:hypothetical protein
MSSPHIAQRLKILLIALLFFGPLALAFYFYYGHGLDQLRPTTQKGHLFEPVRTLPERWEGGGDPPWAMHHWSIWVAADHGVDDDTLQLLADLGKVRLATEKDKDRVEVVLLQPSNVPVSRLQGAVHVVQDDSDLTHVGSALKIDEQSVWNSGRIILVDPNGNAVMWYEKGQNRLDVLNDLLKLLKLSHIG